MREKQYGGTGIAAHRVGQPATVHVDFGHIRVEGGHQERQKCTCFSRRSRLNEALCPAARPPEAIIGQAAPVSL